MIDLVRHYVDLLTGDSIGTAEIVAAVGRATDDPGIPMPVEIAPSSPELRAASLARDRDSGLPYLLTLEPALDRRPTLAALESAFGRCHRARSDRGMPAVYVINPAGSGTAWTVALIVTSAEAGGSDGEVRAAEIALRRDRVAAPDGVAGKAR